MGPSNAELVPRPHNPPVDRQSEIAEFCDRNGTCTLRQGLEPTTKLLVGVVGAPQRTQRVRRRAQVQFCRRTRAVRSRQHDKHLRQRERRIL